MDSKLVVCCRHRHSGVWAYGQTTTRPRSQEQSAESGLPQAVRARAYMHAFTDYYMARCLQEVSYLTSPQAVNPLPNRPLLNSTTLPLQLPNVPFDAYNGRPRKLMPEVGKDFSLMNGMGMTNGPASAPSTAIPQGNLLDRPGMMAPQQQNQAPPLQQAQSQQQPPPTAEYREKEGDGEQPMTTAIFRPGDDWREKLRMSHEAAEQARLDAGQAASGAASWERRTRDEEDDVKDEEGEIEDEDAGVIGDSDSGKVWKARRTLRKSV